jgi:hypothetical protein
VTKLNATGTALVYSTYLGGGTVRSGGAGIALDAAGDAYVTGWTYSTAFPTKNAMQATYPGTTNPGGSAAFVTALNASGSRLLFSTYLGSSLGGSDGFGIAVDRAANMYVVGTDFADKISAVVPTFVVSGFPTTITAGQSATLTVQAMNNGSLNSAYTGTVHFTSSDPQAVLPANAQLVSGTGTFTITFKTAAVQSITATDSVNGLIGSEGGITVDAGPATHFVLSAPTTVVAGVAFSVNVMAFDAYGNPASLYSGTVAITTTDPRATVPSPYTYDDDCFTFSMILLTLGTQTITATDLGFPSIDGLWTINVN